jgi:hypothetical protein
MFINPWLGLYQLLEKDRDNFIKLNLKRYRGSAEPVVFSDILISSVVQESMMKVN